MSPKAIWLAVLLVCGASSLVAADTGEGPARIGSDTYRDAGADGSGIRIAVIDSCFGELEDRQNDGEAPPDSQIAVKKDFTGVGFPCDGVHGSGVLEGVYDHAPGATYYLYQIIGGGTFPDHFEEAVDDAVGEGVHIINHSNVYYNQGWEDGSGVPSAAVKRASDNGVLVFAAAGNSNLQHWRGDFYDPDADNVHNWSGIVEAQSVDVGANQMIRVRLQWDTGVGDTDYDLYLYNFDFTEELEPSYADPDLNGFERIGWTNDGIAETVKIVVVKASGSPAALQLFATLGGKGRTLDHITAGSILPPATSPEPNVIAVGAVNQVDFVSPPGTTGIIMEYSGTGPTNSGNVKPDLCGPTNNTTSYGICSGTSCASPNAAGAAAAFWSSEPQFGASAVRYLILEQAEIFRDWGPAGKDSTYGRGGMSLYPYHENTEWVDRRLYNLLGSPQYPYYTVSQAQDAAESGGRVVFLGGNYPEPILLDKRLLYESIGGPAVLGAN